MGVRARWMGTNAYLCLFGFLGSWGQNPQSWLLLTPFFNFPIVQWTDKVILGVGYVTHGMYRCRNSSSCTNIEGEPMVTYGASCFAHKTEKIYLYRSKYGHWCIGQNLFDWFVVIIIWIFVSLNNMLEISFDCVAGSKLRRMKNGTLLKNTFTFTGSKLGKMKNGTLLKSCERDEEKWAQCCPCRVSFKLDHSRNILEHCVFILFMNVDLEGQLQLDGCPMSMTETWCLHI